MAWQKMQNLLAVENDLSLLEEFIQWSVPLNFTKKMTGIIWLIVAFSLVHVSTACTTPASQVSALNDLYVATNGNNWYLNQGWGVGDPCNNYWYGVSCWSNCTIEDLELINNNLNGTIPSTIGNLVNLQDLFLSTNNLSGTIPSTIANLVNLGALGLDHNKLSGTIPSIISNLVRLENLYLDYNNLSGTIPSTIGNMVNLENLWLYNNNLSGIIPSIISNLTKLEFLQLDNNNLSGTIPSTIGNLVNLGQLGLSNNNLTGTIPSTIGNLSNLQYLLLEGNNLSGTIPSTIGNMVSLGQLYLNDNQLNGTVPWQQNPHMSYFNISNNQFSCPLPLWCSPLPTGDGLCAPCVNVITSQLQCCYYSDDGCQDITLSSCVKGSSCPTVGGLQNCGQVITSDCDKCLLNKKRRLNIN